MFRPAHRCFPVRLLAIIEPIAIAVGVERVGYQDKLLPVGKAVPVGVIIGPSRKTVEFGPLVGQAVAVVIPRVDFFSLSPLFVPHAKVGYNRDRSINRSGIPFKPASSIEE